MGDDRRGGCRLIPSSFELCTRAEAVRVRSSRRRSRQYARRALQIRQLWQGKPLKRSAESIIEYWPPPVGRRLSATLQDGGWSSTSFIAQASPCSRINSQWGHQA